MFVRAELVSRVQRRPRWLVDGGLVVAAALMIVTDMTVLFFHAVFVLLTVAAFFLPLRAFAWRVGVWVTLTTLVVLRAIVVGDTQAEEAIEIPLLTTILVLVFAIAGHRQRARAELEGFRSMIRNSSDVIIVAGADGRVRYASPSVERVFGYAPSQVEGRPLDELVPPADQSRVRDAREPGELRSVVAEHGIRAASGELRMAETTFTDLGGDPTVRGTVLNTRDITERNLLAQELVRLAHYDPLTGLANRSQFNDRMEHAEARAQRTGEKLAVLFMDLDGFKQVNDQHGHHAGDLLLAAAADRIRAVLRDSDTVARLGGDEFAVLMEGLSDPSFATRTAERLCDAFRAPFDLEGGAVVQVGLSLGVATIRDGEGHDPLRDADIAMYRAKALGKGRWELFDPMRDGLVDAISA